MGKYVNGVYVPDAGETDNRYMQSVQPHSRPLEAPTPDEIVVRSSRAAQRQAQQQANINAAKASPVANNVQQLVDAAQVAPAGAVGNDSPDIQKANLFAKKYAPMLRGEEVKPAGEQLLADRTAKYQNQLMPKTPAKTVDPNSDTDGMNSILGNWTSKEDEEKYRKASVARQRIMAVADALRHIGNIYHTTKYAPSQKFNMPVEAERQRYQQEKALRDQANQRIISYQQAKAKLDADQKRWEADYGLKVADAARKAGATEAQIKNMQDKLKEQQRMNDLTHGLNQDRLAWQKERGDRQDKELARHHRVSEGQNAQRINLQKQKLEWQKSGGGNGSNVPPLDTPNGKIQPSGRNYGNQLLQMWDYAKDNNLVSESDVQKALREAGFGNETPDNVKRQQVLSLLRTNKLLGDYAVNRLGWSSGGMSGGLNLGLDDEDDDMDLRLD